VSAGVSRPVLNTLSLEFTDDPGGKAPRHRHSVAALHLVIDSLPFGDPAVLRTRQGNDPVKVGAGTLMDSVSVVLEMKELVTVLTAIKLKLVKRLNE